MKNEKIKIKPENAIINKREVLYWIKGESLKHGGNNY